MIGSALAGVSFLTRTEIVLGQESSERLKALVARGFLDDAGVIIVL